MKKVKMKKGQIEIVGLVVIVILIVFIAIFSIPFILKQKSNELDDDYLQIVSNNLRSAVLNTNICSLASVKQEILSCRNNIPICLSDCNELSNTIGNIITSSLGSLGTQVNYRFSANDILVEGGNCIEKVSSSKAYIENIEVKVDLCYK